MYCIFCKHFVKKFCGRYLFYEDMPNGFDYHVMCWWIVKLLDKLGIEW